jgi:hypothetical protein
VIPIRSAGDPESGALERAIGAPAGRGRAVLLAVRSGIDPSPQLRAARECSLDTVRYVVVDAEVHGADALASRILADQCSAAPPCPRAVLRAWVAHLASEGRELAVGLDRAGELSLDAATWLGRLVRASRDCMRVIVPWAGDPRIWRIVEELGLETEVVSASPPQPRAERAEPYGPVPAAAPTPASTGVSSPPRVAMSARHHLLGAVLGCLGLVVASVWLLSTRAEPPGEPEAREAPAPAFEARSAAPTGSTAPSITLPEPSPRRYAYDAQADRISFRVSGRPLAQVLAELSAQLGFDVRNLTSDPLSRPVSLQVERQPLEDALRQLLRGFARTFVYASAPDGNVAPRLRTVIVLAATPPVPAARTEDAVPADEPDRSGSIALEVEAAIQTLVAHDPGTLHAEAIERLVALGPAAVADEALRQFDALTPVGPLAPTRVEAAWERLRAALCAARPPDAERGTLPPELGCRPSSAP